MAFNSGILLVFMVSLMSTICGVSYGVVYKVGDSEGWTYTPSVDYKEWASNKSFHVGDVIVFEYEMEYHNVLEVRHDDFRTCNVASPLVTYSSGNDSITLKMPGHYFYICGFPGHCQVGQKIDFRVLPPVGSPITPSPPLSGLQPPPSSGPPNKSDASSTVYHSSFGPWALLVLGLWVSISGYQSIFLELFSCRD